MTITQRDTASVLYFSREELQAVRLTPSRLSEDDSLRLIHHALAKARRPIPSALEVSSFPSRHGVLFFVSPLPQDLEYARSSAQVLS